MGVRKGVEVFHTSCKVTLVGSKYASEVDQIVWAAASKFRQGSAICRRLFAAQWRCGDWKINLREADYPQASEDQRSFSHRASLNWPSWRVNFGAASSSQVEFAAALGIGNDKCRYRMSADPQNRQRLIVEVFARAPGEAGRSGAQACCTAVRCRIPFTCVLPCPRWRQQECRRSVCMQRC